MAVGKPALIHIPPPTGMECEAFDFRKAKVSLLYCGKTFDSACMILFSLLLHVLFVWVSFGNTESVLCVTLLSLTSLERVFISAARCTNSSSAFAVSLGCLKFIW